MFDLASVFAISGLAFIYVHRIVLTPGLISGWDWPIPPEGYHFEVMFSRRLWSWWYDPAFTGFPVNPVGLSALSYEALLYLESLCGLNGEAISKMMLVSLLALSGISAYCLLKYLKLSFLARITGSIFYMSLPVMVDWLVVLGPASIVTTYALFPATFLFYLKALSPQGNRLKWCILASLTSTGVYPIFGIIISSFIFLAHTMWMILSTRSVEIIKKHLITLGIIFLITFVTQFWWVQSLLFSQWQQELASMVQSIGSHPTSLIYSFGLMGHYLPVYENYLIEQKIPLIAIFAYPMLALSALFYKKDRETLFFSVLALLFILFWGTQWGFALVKSNFLMFGVFRDMSKVAAIPSLCYTILTAHVIDKIIRKTRQRHRKIVVVVLLVILISAYIEPRLRGDLFTSPPQNTVWSPGWTFAADFIKQQPGDFKTLWVPTGSYSIERGSGNNISWSIDFYGVYSPKPGLVIGHSQRPLLVPEYWLTNLFFPRKLSPAAQTVPFEPASISRILGLFNVQYLIYRNVSSFNWFTTHSSPVWERNSAAEMNYLETQIRADLNLTEIWKVSDVSIFNNTKNLPHFFGTSSLVIAGADLSLIRSLSTMPNNFSFDDMAVAFAIQQDNDKVLSLADFLMLEGEQDILDLLIPLVPNAQKIEAGMYAKQEMAKEWSDVHLWYWVYENYQESFERIAATNSSQARLSVPFNVVEDGTYLIFSKVYLSPLGSQLGFNVKDSSFTSLGKANADTLDIDQAGFRWMLISSAATKALNSSILSESNLRPWNLTKGSYTMEIDNLSGENAVASILIVPSAEFKTAALELQKVIEEKPILLFQSGISDLTATLREQKEALTPRISWQRVNPTRYVVSIEGSSGLFYMIFLERYDERWDAFIQVENKRVDLHFPVYGYANAWAINKTGDFDVIVTYSPQEMMDVSLKVSFLAYLACILSVTYSSLAFFVKKRIKCKTHRVRSWNSRKHMSNLQIESNILLRLHNPDGTKR